MSKRIDLTGQRFGRLTVIKEDPMRDKRGLAKWICQCDCGNTVSIVGSRLRSGHTKSCGCLKLNVNELGGQRFGRLTAIKRDPARDDQGRTRWICKCDCGNTISATEYFLRIGYIKSCGCLSKENAIKALFKYDIDGTRVSKLLSKKLQSNNTSGKRGVHWDKQHNKWVAQIGFKKKRYRLGFTSDFEEACRLRDEAEEHIFGDFLSWYAKMYPEQWKSLNEAKRLDNMHQALSE